MIVYRKRNFQSTTYIADRELRVITRRNGRFCAQYREFTRSDAPYLTKFNKTTVKPRGTMLAETISVERRSKTKLLVFECATMREDGMSERLPMIRVNRRMRRLVESVFVSVRGLRLFA
jgi:hypothetical protein